MLVALCIGMSSIASKVKLDETPSKQTAFQAALVARVRQESRRLSESAKPRLLEALASPNLRSKLRKCCPGIADEPATSLLTLLVDSFRSAELTHNFNANATGTWEGDIDIEHAIATPFLPNLWTAEYLKLAAPTDQPEEDKAEVGIMGFRPFSDGKPVGRGSKPVNLSEAIERPLYTTSNLLHIDIGSTIFGDVSMILTPSYAQPMALLEPVDTGNWEVCSARARYPSVREPACAYLCY